MPGRRDRRKNIFVSTVRVVIESRRDIAGRSVRLENPEIGTACIVEVGHPRHIRNRIRFYLVTAAHVVKDADEGTLLFRRQRGEAGESALFSFTRRDLGELWYYPRTVKADVAITPVSIGEIASAFAKQGAKVVASPFVNPAADAYTPSYLQYVGDFEEVLFVGYPLGFWDPSSGTPIVRRGVTATPFHTNYQGEPAFLIDGAVFPGCSGGPVTVIERELIVPPDPSDSFGPPLREEEREVFLGIITDVFDRLSDGERVSLHLARVLRSEIIFAAISEYEQLTSPPSA
jgi:hypothetical protein